MSRDWLEQALDEIVAADPDWARTLVEDVERYGLKAVVDAINRRRPGNDADLGKGHEPPYPGSTKSLIKLQRAMSKAAERSEVLKEHHPDVMKLYQGWRERLERARYWVVERSPGSVILGDVAMLVQYAHGGVMEPFDLEQTHRVVAVFLPISGQRILVASLDRKPAPRRTTTDAINVAMAGWSEFFVASRRSPRFEKLRRTLISKWIEAARRLESGDGIES